MNDDIEFTDDLQIDPSTGDWKVINVDDQGVEFILRARPGHFYQWPTLGVGVDRYKMGSVNKQTVRQLVKLHLESDSYRVDDVIVGGNIDQLIIETDTTKKNQ